MLNPSKKYVKEFNANTFLFASKKKK